MAIKYKWLAGTLRDLIKKDVKNEINKLPSEQEPVQTLSRQPPNRKAGSESSYAGRSD